MSAFLVKEGCSTVGFEKSMWTVTIDGARILLGVHIDDFVIACAKRQILFVGALSLIATHFQQSQSAATDPGSD